MAKDCERSQFRDRSRKHTDSKSRICRRFGRDSGHCPAECLSYQATAAPKKSGQSGRGLVPTPKSAPWAPPGTRIEPGRDAGLLQRRLHRHRLVERHRLVGVAVDQQGGRRGGRDVGRRRGCLVELVFGSPPVAGSAGHGTSRKPVTPPPRSALACAIRSVGVARSTIACSVAGSAFTGSGSSGDAWRRHQRRQRNQVPARRSAHAADVRRVDAVVLRVVPDEADRALHVLDRAGVVEARHGAMVQREDGVAGLQERRAPDRDLVLLERRRVVGRSAPASRCPR